MVPRFLEVSRTAEETLVRIDTTLSPARRTNHGLWIRPNDYQRMPGCERGGRHGYVQRAEKVGARKIINLQPFYTVRTDTNFLVPHYGCAT